MKKNLKKLKPKVAAKRPGGRRKGHGEKYNPAAPLIAHYFKARLGPYGDWGITNIVRELLAKLQTARSRNEHIPEMEKLLTHIRFSIIDKDYVELKHLYNIFTFQSKLAERDEAADPFRASLIEANCYLFAMAHIDKANKNPLYTDPTKKKNLLKVWRDGTPAGHQCEEKEDADIFKTMRQLGLPREPQEIVLSGYVSELKRKGWK